MRRLVLSSFEGRQREVAGLVVWSVVEALPAFLSGRLVARAIDHGFLVHRPAAGLAWLALLGASMLAGAWGTRQIFHRLAALVEPFRDRLVTLAVGGALQTTVGTRMPGESAGVARVTQQVEIVREAYASVLMVTQVFLVTTVSALVGLFTLVPIVMVFVLPPVLAGIGLFVATLGPLAECQRASLLAEEGIAESTTAVTSGLRDVVACGGEDRAGADVGRHIDGHADATIRLGRITAVRTLAVALGGLLPIVLVLIAGPWLIRHGTSTGMILGALTYLLTGVHPAMQTLVRGLAGSVVWLLVGLRRIVETTTPSGEDAGPGSEPEILGSPPGPSRPLSGVISRPRHRSFGAVRRRRRARRQRRDVRLRQVTFRYGPSADPIISELDLTIPEGDHLAIVGPSGVGKSTLASVVSGLLVAEHGHVRYGNVPARRLADKALSARRVLIPQEAYVFAGPLRENLAYLRAEATDEDLDHAIGALGMRPLIERLGGYDAEIQPSGLSAGERQLIALARAYLSAAPLVVLDEATCHLDPAHEARVESAFVRRGGALVVIAHRMSSALRARRILVMDGTRVVVGAHSDLMAESALYRDLVGQWCDGRALGAATNGSNGKVPRASSMWWQRVRSWLGTGDDHGELGGTVELTRFEAAGGQPVEHGRLEVG